MEKGSSNETILQRTKDIVEASDGLTTRLGIDTGGSLHNAIQDGRIMACKQQSFVSLHVLEYNAMKTEVSALWKFQQSPGNKRRVFTEELNQLKREANKVKNISVMNTDNTEQLCF